MANGTAKSRTTPPQPLRAAGPRVEGEERAAVPEAAESGGLSPAGADEPGSWADEEHPVEHACAYLRQVHGQVNWFQRNDGTEMVRVKAHGFAYDAPTLVEATELLKGRIDRFAGRRLKGFR